MAEVSTFISATSAFTRLVREIPADAWDGPGLGEWNLRSLVGHTSRSLITVLEYSQVPAVHEDLPTAQAYYARIKTATVGGDPAGIVERGRQAGLDLGRQPVQAVEALAAQAIELVASSEDSLITVIGGLGIRLHAYLRTRIFELAVHSLDISAAIKVEFTPPEDVLGDATTLAALIATVAGDGPTVLGALTGRSALPPSFSVV